MSVIKSVSPGQAYALARAYNLGSKTEAAPEGGFSAFVPCWVPVDNDAGNVAARLLTEAGANFGSAKAALDYIIGSRPTTPAGKAYRGVKGLALLLQQPVPAMPVMAVEQVAKPAFVKAETSQVSVEELAMALEIVRAMRALRNN